MNILLHIIDSIVGFVSRNPIFCLVVLILAIGAPSLLAGIASVILYVVLGLILLIGVLSLLLRWRIYKLQRDFGRQQQGYDPQNNSRREGDISVHINRDQSGKRINDDVGDYVDFVEEKNNDR